jgi:paraquat-inducible protein A
MTECQLLTERYPAETRMLRMLLAAASILLGIGLVSPVITLEKFIIINNTFSVLSGLAGLLQEGEIFLFVIITGFSVILPVLKLAVLFRLVSPSVKCRDRFHKYLELMHDYGRWSMLDVFVVAIMVVAVKLGALADVHMRYGMYAFAAAVVLTMVVTSRVVSLTDALNLSAEKGA